MAEIDADPDLDVETRAKMRAKAILSAREEEIFADIEREIDPASWKTEAGISVLEGGTMSVDQSAVNHEQIKHWLARKRCLPGAEDFLQRMRLLVVAAIPGVCVMHYSLRLLVQRAAPNLRTVCRNDLRDN